MFRADGTEGVRDALQRMPLQTLFMCTNRCLDWPSVMCLCVKLRLQLLATLFFFFFCPRKKMKTMCEGLAWLCNWSVRSYVFFKTEYDCHLFCQQSQQNAIDDQLGAEKGHQKAKFRKISCQICEPRKDARTIRVQAPESSTTCNSHRCIEPLWVAVVTNLRLQRETRHFCHQK